MVDMESGTLPVKLLKPTRSVLTAAQHNEAQHSTTSVGVSIQPVQNIGRPYSSLVRFVKPVGNEPVNPA